MTRITAFSRHLLGPRRLPSHRKALPGHEGDMRVRTYCRRSVLLPLLVTAGLLASSSGLEAARPPENDRNLEILPEERELSLRSGDLRISLETDAPLALYREDYPLLPAAPVEMAWQYLRDNAEFLHLNAADLGDLALLSSRSSSVGHTVRIQQEVGGVPVYGAEIAVTINHNNQVIFVMNGYKPLVDLDAVESTLSQSAARQIALEYLQVAGGILYEAHDLVVYYNRGISRLAHRLKLMPAGPPQGDWEVLVDAHSGEVFRVQDKALHVNGSGTVFKPDPLSSALATYGEPGYVDGGDADTSQLTAELFNVTLQDITFSGGVHRLVGPWAECIDWDAPFKGCAEQPSSTFDFTREVDDFEPVNAYYHIDTFMRYLNVTLGEEVSPYQYSGGVQFDAHGKNGADQSSYCPSTGQLTFGEGGVDDAEDADVVIHELGHGIHDWMTMGGLSLIEGLSEGVGDYFAISYSRSLNQWQPSDPEYDWVFSWDGHNEFWPGRVTNWNDSHTYPADLVGQINLDGQFWSSCNIDIADLIGLEAVDRAMIVGLSMTTSGTNQNDAAQAVLQAATELGYPSADIMTMESIYQGCGYSVTAPPRTLTVTKIGTGSGTVTSSPPGISCGLDCSETYDFGTVVALTPTPDAGSAFAGWSGDPDCADGTVTLDADKACTATFDLEGRTLTVTKTGAGSGTVTSSPPGISCGPDCSETYDFGTVVALTPTPDVGSAFAGWSGDPDCADGTVTLDADKACTAVFDLEQLVEILLVDDDNNAPDVRAFYTDALDSLGLLYDVWDTANSDNEPDAVKLSSYATVIWFTGSEFGDFTGPGPAAEASLGAWLDNGACLFLSSQDYHFARGFTPFMSTYLGVESVIGDVGQTEITGVSALGGLGPYLLDYPFGNFSDVISPDGTAQLALLGDQGDAAVSKDSGVYRTLFFGVPFPALPDAAARLEVLDRGLAYCSSGASVEPIFADGFESGDTSSWSGSVP